MGNSYECARCKYHCSSKQTMEKHFLRKAACSVDSDGGRDIPLDVLYTELTGKLYQRYKCDFCSHESSCSSNKLTHMKTCRFKPPNVSKTINHQCTQENEESQKNIMETLPKEVVDELKFLRKEIERLSNCQLTATNTTNHIDIENVQINQFTVHPFGKEDTSHIDTEFLTNCLLNTTKGVASLLNKIHFDNIKPENKNLRVKSKKQNLLEKVVDDGSWEQCDKNNTLDEMIRKGYKILFAHFLATKNDMEHIKENEHILQNWFTDLSSQKGDEYYRLRRDLFVLVLNNTVYFLGKV